ncbi:hypothetical protein PTKIN_Ptkin03bG0247400 [Pterospermum kingtungense]
MVRTLTRRCSIRNSKSFNIRRIPDNSGRRQKNPIPDGNGAEYADDKLQSRSRDTRNAEDQSMENQHVGEESESGPGTSQERPQSGAVQNLLITISAIHVPTRHSSYLMVNEKIKLMTLLMIYFVGNQYRYGTDEGKRFAKLLLGEDMSGGGKGVSSALALSNAVTNLAGNY